MKRPDKLSKEAALYADFLEEKLSAYTSKQTKVRSYLALKKILDDLNKLIFDGVEVNNPETQNVESVDLISEMALINASDKSFDRIFKFIEKIGTLNAELVKMESEIAPEDIKAEEVYLKKGNSVEERVFR